MAQITAAEVNKLRQHTGAGMMDCKKALVEANGDFDAAIDLLRKKGQKVAAKRGENEAKEGQVVAVLSEDKKTGIMVMLNCETDFVAKTDKFTEFVNKIADIAIKGNFANAEDLKAAKYDDQLTVIDKITEQVGVVGEKLDLAAFATVKGDRVIAYNHPGNGIASLVAINQSSDAAAEAATQVAMQVAAMSPIALDKDDVDAETIAKELEIAKDLAIQEGKPAEMAEKIAQGRLGKFFKETTLMNQEYIFDSKTNVKQFLESASKGLTVTAFKRIALK